MNKSEILTLTHFFDFLYKLDLKDLIEIRNLVLIRLFERSLINDLDKYFDIKTFTYNRVNEEITQNMVISLYDNRLILKLLKLVEMVINIKDYKIDKYLED